MVSAKVPYNKDAILKYKMGYHGKKAEKTESKKKGKVKDMIYGQEIDVVLSLQLTVYSL